jgi:hypothetical protein
MGQEVHGNNFNTPKRWFCTEGRRLPAKVDEKKLKLAVGNGTKHSDRISRSSEMQENFLVAFRSAR